MSNNKTTAVYIIGPKDGPFKIGYSENPKARLSTLQVSSPVEMSIHYQQETSPQNAKIIEKLIHRQLSHKRIRGEWFSIPLEEIISEVKFAFITYDSDEHLELMHKLKRL